MKKRISYGLCFLVVFLIEVFIAIYVHDSFIRPYMGDALVVVLIYCFLRVFVPRGVPPLPIYVFAFACFIEILQYFQFVEMLGVKNQILRIALGSTFDGRDILSYAAGCAFIILVEHLISRRKKKGSRL